MNEALAGAGCAVVQSLLIKPERGQPMVDCSARGLELIRRRGILGDCQADPIGPRQVLLVSGDTLDELRLSEIALRANIVTRRLDLDALESGTVLALGRTARVRLTHRCELCAHIGQVSQIADLKALKGRRGYLGVVITGGSLSAGQPVAIAADRYTWVPDHVAARMSWLIRQTPRGRVVPYDLLIRLVGAPRGYLRALPRSLAAMARRGLPVHRVVTSHGTLPRIVSDQERMLDAEGVSCANGAVCGLPAMAWKARGVYFKQLQMRPGQLTLESRLG